MSYKMVEWKKVPLEMGARPLSAWACLLLMLMSGCDRHPSGPAMVSWRQDELVSTPEALSVFESEGTAPKVVLARFHEARTELYVIDNGADRTAPRYVNVAQAVQASGCVAGTNGGFFDLITFFPNGLMVTGGTAVGTFDSDNWAGGLAGATSTGPFLLDQKAFPNLVEVRHLVQTGPWLVRDGVAETGFDRDEAKLARTFIAGDGAGTWLLGHVNEMTLSELAAFLVSKTVEPIASVRSALNLDGGPSSGIYVARKSPLPALHHPEGTVVRNWIGLKLR